MALQKTIATTYGVNATYHKIALTNINWHNHQAHIEIISFADQQARNEGKAPLVVNALDFDADTFDFEPTDNIVEEVYNKMKETPEFNGAIDV